MEAEVEEVGGKSGGVSARHYLLLLGMVGVSGYSYFIVRDFLTHANAQTRLKLIGAGMWFYCSDFDDRLPLSGNWGEAIKSYLNADDPDLDLRDPFLSGEPEDRGFGFNSAMASQMLSQLDTSTEQMLVAQTMTPGASAQVTVSTLRVSDLKKQTLWVLPTGTIPRKMRADEARTMPWKPKQVSSER